MHTVKKNRICLFRQSISYHLKRQFH